MAGSERIEFLDQQILDRHKLDYLVEKGLINSDELFLARDMLHPAHAWGRWALLLFSFSGTLLVLAGIIFFFAFNWAELSSFFKLGLIEAALILSAFGAWFFGAKKLVGQLFLLSASVLVGVFLAVFGQIYQTGADSWQLFALWAVLILPWTVLSQFAVHWLLWMGLVHLGLALWWDLMPWPSLPQEHILAMILGVVNGTALLLAIILRHRWSWLDAQWIFWLLTALLLGSFFGPLVSLLTDTADMFSSPLSVVIAFLGCLVYVVLFVLNRFYSPDLVALTLWALAVCILLLLGIAEQFDAVFSSSWWQALILSITSIVIFGFAAGYLRGLQSRWGGAK